MISKDQEYDLRAFIAVCEAGWKGSPCWHVVDWMSYRMSNRYPLVRECDRVISVTVTS